jgi:hypothetical protein
MLRYLWCDSFQFRCQSSSGGNNSSSQFYFLWHLLYNIGFTPQKLIENPIQPTNQSTNQHQQQMWCSSYRVWWVIYSFFIFFRLYYSHLFLVLSQEEGGPDMMLSLWVGMSIPLSTLVPADSFLSWAVSQSLVSVALVPLSIFPSARPP